MKKLAIHNCPLCDGAHFNRVMVCTDHYATGEKFSICCCKECGFHFTQKAPVEAEIGRYYESPDYISHSNTHKGVMNTVYHWVRAFQLNKKARLVARTSHRKTGRLLDIGTGTGYFANKMVDKGWEVEAIEKNAQARAFATEHFKLEILDEEALPTLPKNSFHVITLWHVMEHIENLNELWEQLHSLLTEDGILIIAVPNCGSYDANKYKEYWAAYDVPRHLWHFTPTVMQQFGIRHRFILTEQLPMPFDAFYVSMLSEKYKGASPFMAFLKGIYTGTIALFKSLGAKKQSSSIIYIFRKK